MSYFSKGLKTAYKVFSIFILSLQSLFVFLLLSVGPLCSAVFILTCQLYENGDSRGTKSGFSINKGLYFELNVLWLKKKVFQWYLNVTLL